MTTITFTTYMVKNKSREKKTKPETKHRACLCLSLGNIRINQASKKNILSLEFLMQKKILWKTKFATHVSDSFIHWFIESIKQNQVSKPRKTQDLFLLWIEIMFTLWHVGLFVCLFVYTKYTHTHTQASYCSNLDNKNKKITVFVVLEKHTRHFLYSSWYILYWKFLFFDSKKLFPNLLCPLDHNHRFFISYTTCCFSWMWMKKPPEEKKKAEKHWPCYTERLRIFIFIQKNYSTKILHFFRENKNYVNYYLIFFHLNSLNLFIHWINFPLSLFKDFIFFIAQ